MNTNAISEQEGVDKRTIRAATESMTTIALGSGEYKVYSGTRKSYVVDLVNETCECPSAEYQPGPCKHLRRVEMEAGLRETPDLGRRTDVEIMTGARAGEEPIAIADGGTIAAPEPQGSEDEDDEDEVECVCELDPDGLGCFEHFEASDEETAAADADQEVSD